MLESLSKITKRITPRFVRRVTKEHQGQIIALGGGGFSDQPGNLLLDEYILLQTNKTKPKILFLPTAGGDHPDYIDKFYGSYKKLNCKPSHLELIKRNYTYKYLERIVLGNDAVFVGGGSPRFLMQIWRKSGMDKIIKKAWQEGIILSGMSAGAICWYEDGFKNPSDNIWARISCLGFLKGSFCTHYDKRGELRKAYRKMISSGELENGYGVQDGVALHYIGQELKYVISSESEAKAFYVKKSGFRVTEKEIKTADKGILEEFVNLPQEEKIPASGNSEEVVKAYINKINSHDIDGLISLISEDHTFIDSMGINTHGKENMRSAWDTYLTFFPDYTINAKEMICKNGMVAVFGTAKGTLATDGKILPENSFEIPASWTAVVKDRKISVWRVYADNDPVRKLIAKYKNK